MADEAATGQSGLPTAAESAQSASTDTNVPSATPSLEPAAPMAETPNTFPPTSMPEQVAAEATAAPSEETSSTQVFATTINVEPSSSDSLMPVSPAADTPQLNGLTPLEIGKLLQERFTILEIISQNETGITYRARDGWRCPTCDFVNEADAVYCSNCGREMTERGNVLLLERENSAELSPPPDLVVETRAYHLQPDAPSNTDPSPRMPSLRLQFATASDVGVVRGSAREPNEDSAFALAFSAIHESEPHPTLGVFIVADGVGGSEAGELASKKAIQVLSNNLLQNLIAPLLQGETLDDNTARENIRAAILDANIQVMQLAAEKHNDMGTTVTLVFIHDTRAYIANVGDSRTYLVRDAKLAPITQDHSLVASLVSANMIAPEEVYTHPQRNIILRSLGANAELEVDVFPLEGGALTLQAGDRLLLCSDGLWEMVRDFDLESILLRDLDIHHAASNLIAAANEGGGEDNVTLVLVSVV